MNISELIKELTALQNKYGDTQVNVYIDDCGDDNLPIQEFIISNKDWRLSEITNRYEITSVPPYIILSC